MDDGRRGARDSGTVHRMKPIQGSDASAFITTMSRKDISISRIGCFYMWKCHRSLRIVICFCMDLTASRRIMFRVLKACGRL